MSDGPSTPPDMQPEVAIASADIPLDEPISKADAQWPGPLRYGVGIVLITICAADLLLILPLLQILLLGFLIAFIMFIPSRALSGRTRLPYGLSVVVSFLIAAAIVIGLALLLLPEIWRALDDLRASIQQAYTQLAALQDNSAPNTTVQIAGASIPASDLVSLLRRFLPMDAADVLTGLAHLMFGLFGNLAGFIAAFGTASVVALFFLIDLPISGGAMTNWVPRQCSREIALLFGKLDVLWLKFFRALIVIGVIAGAASLGLFVLSRMDGALILAVVTATIGLIPVIGRIFAILLIFAAAPSPSASWWGWWRPALWARC